MGNNSKKYQILILVFLMMNIGLVKIRPDFEKTSRNPAINPRTSVDSDTKYVEDLYLPQFGTTYDFSNMQLNNDDYARIVPEDMGSNFYSAHQVFSWSTDLFNYDDVDLYIDIHSDVIFGNSYTISVGTNYVSLHSIGTVIDLGLWDWDVTAWYQPGSTFYVAISYNGAIIVPSDLEVERLYIVGTDVSHPSWLKGGSFPPEGQWYSSNPVINLTFQDNINLFDGDWDVNNDNPNRFLFGNVDDTTWTNPAWTMDTSVWNSLAEETVQPHILYLEAIDDYDNPNIWSWTFYKDTLPPSTPPTLANISPDPDYDGDIYLNWDVISDATSYNVYRDTSYISSLTGLDPIASPVAPEYNDNSGLSPGMYHYVVTAVDHGGESGISNCESVSVEIAAPDQPILSAITTPNYDGEIYLNWNDVSGVTTYRVYRNTQYISSIVGLTPIAYPSYSFYTDSVSTSGTYYYVVTAYGTGGESSKSNCEGVDFTAPQSPTLEVIEPNPNTDGDVILEWNDVSGATSYKVYRSTTSIETIESMTPIATPTTSSYSDTGLKSGTYYYVVTAVGPGGESEISTLRSILVDIQRLPEKFWWWVGGIAAVVGAVPGGYFIIKKLKERRANKAA